MHNDHAFCPQVVKASTKPINQFEQHTSKVPDGDANGIKKSRIKPLSEHVVDAFRYDKDGLALYMHNLALIEVRRLQRKLYQMQSSNAQHNKSY